VTETDFTSDGHAVTLVFGQECIHAQLICPKDDDGRCTAMGDDQAEECWLQTWFDNVAAEEMYSGDPADLTGRTLPLPIAYRNAAAAYLEEGPEWRFA
jgi:hypothetical protein